MLTATDKQTLRTKLEKYEGRTSHMYLDSKGYVTIGVGHLLRDVTEAQKLAFRTARILTASATDIKTDYAAVQKLPGNRLVVFYRPHTSLTISDLEIDRLTDQHIDSFGRELRFTYVGFDTFPTEVKLALFDLIFNLGATNLRSKWLTFNAAVRARDWQKSADNSDRAAPISAERNKYVKDLLEKAAKLAQSGQSKK